MRRRATPLLMLMIGRVAADDAAAMMPRCYYKRR